MSDVNKSLEPYAIKFIFADERNPSDLSDASLEKAFAHCARRVKPEEYAIIREHIKRLIYVEPVQEGQLEMIF